jgi:hypothetical protein
MPGYLAFCLVVGKIFNLTIHKRQSDVSTHDKGAFGIKLKEEDCLDIEFV